MRNISSRWSCRKLVVHLLQVLQNEYRHWHEWGGHLQKSQQDGSRERWFHNRVIHNCFIYAITSGLCWKLLAFMYTHTHKKYCISRWFALTLAVIWGSLNNSYTSSIYPTHFLSIIILTGKSRKDEILTYQVHKRSSWISILVGEKKKYFSTVTCLNNKKTESVLLFGGTDASGKRGRKGTFGTNHPSVQYNIGLKHTCILWYVV